MRNKQNGAFWMRPAYYWSAAALIGIGIFVTIAVEWIDEQQVRDLKLEIVKVALQIVIVGIIGGVIKQALDEQKALAAFRVDVVAALGKAHSQIYRLRRSLALCDRDPEIVRQCMFELMDIRNDLGSTGHMARTKEDIGQHEVLANIAQIRAYFEDLIVEAMSAAQDGNMTIGPQLEEFIAGCRAASTGADTYSRRFKAPYLRAKKAADPTWKLSGEQLRTMALTAEPSRASASPPTAA